MEEIEIDESGVWCGFRGEHTGHNFFKPGEMMEERYCNGYSPAFKSNPEPDEAFVWEDDEEEIYSI